VNRNCRSLTEGTEDTENIISQFLRDLCGLCERTKILSAAKAHVESMVDR
jgi:hypothetical protein